MAFHNRMCGICKMCSFFSKEYWSSAKSESLLRESLSVSVRLL